ncbi:MAG: hypothetical protein FWG65_02040 [Turicibacter sp.]|nr:hypothetical protein [Turicibacter sp.]
MNTIIRTNVAAANAHRQMSGAGIRQQQASARLASGQRINSAADDVAGLGIAQKMRAQIVGLDRASLNAQDATSLIQTADGALSGVNEMLIRVRELVVQASNDTNAHDEDNIIQSDRRSIQDEIDQIMFEINNVAYRTEFNTRTLLDGSLSSEGMLVGEMQTVSRLENYRAANITTVDQFLNLPSNTPFEGTFAELLRATGANLEGLEPREWVAVQVARHNLIGLEAAIQEVVDWDTLELRTGLNFANATYLLDAFVAGSEFPHNSWEDLMDDPDPLIRSIAAETFVEIPMSGGGLTVWEALRDPGIAGLHPDSTFEEVRNVFVLLGNAGAGGGFGLPHHESIADALEDWLERRGTTWPDFIRDELTGSSRVVEHEIFVPSQAERERGTPLWFHIGANSNQGISVSINSVSTRSLGEPFGDLMRLINVENVSGRPISEQLDIMDSALTRVNRERAGLGAVANRLEFTMLNLDIASENLSAAHSRIVDADMAKEVMNLHSANFLSQAATAMVAMANQNPQAVLSLLEA